MTYGSSAARELVRQFETVCRLSESEDKTIMTPKASHNIVRTFWYSDPELKQLPLKQCEQTVFIKLMDKKRLHVIVDGPHVEAYIYEMAHEITKLRRNDPNMPISHPYVTITKKELETLIKNTKILPTGTIEKVNSEGEKVAQLTHIFKPPDEAKDADVLKEQQQRYEFKKPEMPKQMKRVYDVRQGMPIVIAKRDYGNYN